MRVEHLPSIHETLILFPLNQQKELYQVSVGPRSLGQSNTSQSCLSLAMGMRQPHIYTYIQKPSEL